MSAAEVEIDPPVLAMAGHEHAGLGVVAVGERNAGVGRGADRRRHARAHLEGDAMLGQRLDLLAAAAEQERIAALEAQHAASPPGRG